MAFDIEMIGFSEKVSWKFKNGEVVYQSTGYLPGDEFKLETEIKKALEIEK